MPEQYERSTSAVFKITAPPGERIGQKQRATVKVEKLGTMWFVTVRPYRCSRVYRLPLSTVAAMVCDRVARLEADKAVISKKDAAGLRRLNRQLSRAVFGR
jgi:hypothetical protein